MQALGPNAIAERFRPRTIALGGAVVTLALLLATVPAGPIAADIALAAAAAFVGGGSALVWREARRIAMLPLEVAPVAGSGTIDGATVYRFRARLGRGRTFRDPQVDVRFAPSGGDPIALGVERLPSRACGPLTIVVRDASERVRLPGAFHVRVRVTSSGRPWEATVVVDAGAVRPGRFGGIGVVRGRLAFDDRWAALDPEA